MSGEVCEIMSPCLVAGTVVDATVGGGGHIRRLLEKASLGSSYNRCRLLGLDIDGDALKFAREALRDAGYRVLLIDSYLPKQAMRVSWSAGPTVILVRSNYAEMEHVIDWLDMRPVSGILFDFGVSLHQLTCPDRGFGYDIVGEADMRFDQTGANPPAWELLQRASESELSDWLWRYGDETHARRIARRLYQERRRIRTTKDIAEAVKSCTPAVRLRKTLARVFLALRIVVNRELENVSQGLAVALRLLEPGGRLVAISYHSGEDRIVKSALREGLREGRLQLWTRKPLRPALSEIRGNPRVRSARLRAAEVVA